MLNIFQVGLDYEYCRVKVYVLQFPAVLRYRI